MNFNSKRSVVFSVRRVISLCFLASVRSLENDGLNVQFSRMNFNSKPSVVFPVRRVISLCLLTSVRSLESDGLTYSVQE